MNDNPEKQTPLEVTPTMRLEEAQGTWDALAQYLERFIEAWESSAAPPVMEEFLPGDSQKMHKLVLVELIKVDLEYRHQSGREAFSIEHYADRFPDLSSGDGPPVDLIYEEFHIRRSTGEDVEPAEYLKRFPNQVEQLRQLMTGDILSESTRLFNRSKAAALETGDTIDDFEIISVLGAGAFGCVYLARQISLQRWVALKISKEQGLEPETLAQLDHPHIVRVFDQRPVDDMGAHLLYMQLVPGGTLADVVKRVSELPMSERSGEVIADSVRESLRDFEDRLPLETVVPTEMRRRPWHEVVCVIGEQLATALDHAHSHGVLHRDVKPANVLLSADGSVKLADFNVSYCSSLAGAAPRAFFGGSLAYMSPEQLEAFHPALDREADDLDQRSDIYAVAVVLWELLHGERPFGDEEISTNWNKALNELLEMRRLGIQAKACDSPSMRRLQGLLVRCLSPDREDRPGSGRELARELLLCLEPRGALMLDRGPRFQRWPVFWPLVTVILAALIPNVAAGYFNFVYNKEAIIDQVRESENAFWNIQAIINGIAFPGAVLLICWYCWPIVTAIRQGSECASESLTLALRRSLEAGQFIAVLGVILWVIAGATYPIALQLVVGRIEWHHFLHFVSSLALCGLIAAAYPFFIVTLLALRGFWPQLLKGCSPGVEQLAPLDTLEERIPAYTFIAGAIPATASLLIVLSGALKAQDQHLSMLAWISAFGVIGFGIAVLLNQRLRRDITAWKNVIRLLADR
ncbi:MAG: serine/threonine protein kinase [Pirellulaceae bacterium]|jgi:serine/threonine protein kinase